MESINVMRKRCFVKINVDSNTYGVRLIIRDEFVLLLIDHNAKIFFFCNSWFRCYNENILIYFSL